MNIITFLEKLQHSPKTITFQETIAAIDANYNFTPAAFQNGNQHNAAGENSGSCKVFSFARLNQLSATETLFLFGEHYQKVLQTPEDTDHQNIRNFIEMGWNGIKFEGTALELKSKI